MSDLLTTPRPRLSRADLFALIALIAIGVAFFWRMTFTELILPRGDVFTYFYPYWEYRNAAFRAGHVPLWNPHLFMGVPFLANSQAGVLYPPNWLLIPFDGPTAVKVAIVTHSIWTAVGTYLFARRAFHLSVMSSTLAAITFAFGGYLTAQVEHVNQLQGLAWMPWLFWLWDESLGNRRYSLWLALALGMQILAGHTQSAFMSGVGLGLWALWHVSILRRDQSRAAVSTSSKSRLRRVMTSSMPLSRLAAASLLALGLAAAQLAPTIELTRLSNRSGGLPFRDAVSFSLRPELIGRALVPGYGTTSLFTEYIAYVGIVALILAIIGTLLSRSSWKRFGLVILAGIGLFFALGKYNPVYWVLVFAMPGFNLFRAPARWLVLWSFGVALLAGVGLDALSGISPIMPIEGGDPRIRFGRRVILAAVGTTVLLIALVPLATLSPDPLVGVVQPTLLEAALWLGITVVSSLLAVLLTTTSTRALSFAPPALVALAAIELFIASQSLPFNHLSTPAAWSSQRPAISTLLAEQSTIEVPARFLSLSDIRFDPGDLSEINAILGPHLTEDALYDYIIAVKQKEILAPNLPLAWNIPSMDGFDGGILPTRAYTLYTGLFLPGDAEAVDGRLREYLHAVPDRQWLSLSDVDYVITDKVYDAWLEGIYYDLQFTERRTDDNAPIVMAPSQPFEATALGLIGHFEGVDNIPDGTQVAEAIIHLDDDDIILPLIVGEDFTEADSVGHFTIDAPEVAEFRSIKSWDDPHSIEQIEVRTSEGTLVLRGATLIDEHTGAFLPLSFSPEVRTIQSGDVKIYAISGGLSRAYLVCNPAVVATEALMWDRMQSGHIPVVLDTSPVDCDSESGTAEITTYEPEHIEIEVTSANEGAYLILSDAWYPGWQATIDGAPVSVLKANGLFRAIRLTEGDHHIVFTYHSQALQIGVGISIVSLIAVVIGLVIRQKRALTQP